MSVSSPFYWIVVVVAAVAFARVVTMVLGDREELPLFRSALVVYVGGWGIVGAFSGIRLLMGLPVGPPWPALWKGLPGAVTIALATVFVGGMCSQEPRE